MPNAEPRVVVIAGPNGAGKSTAAPALLRGFRSITDFVNADIIAQQLAPGEPERAALSAGRMMLARMRELTQLRWSFAFETTLATRHFAPWLEGMLKNGYSVHLVFLWLPSPDAAVARVEERVRSGGHGIPLEVIRRRYERGLRNFFTLYRPLATSWRMYDNAGPEGPQLVATGRFAGTERVYNPSVWKRMTEASNE